MPGSFAHCFREREWSGHGRKLAHALAGSRARLLDFSQRKVVATQHEGAIVQLSLDPIELRYLLAGAADATVAIYDTSATLSEAAGTELCPPVLKIARNNSSSHKYSITSVAWYPIDSGLFVTGSLDNDVKVWDTNTVQAACAFPFESKVYAVGMSPVASAHCLVAVAGAQPQIKLCDPASGSFTHVLGGHEGSHREDVWALHWSLHNEWHLLTGGCDGQVRLWDIRRSRTFHMLDEQQTNKPGPSAAKLARKRSHDGHAARRLSSSKVSVAHEGSVTAILPTSDGRQWLTAGTDSRLRMWDACNFRNLLVNYRNTYNRANKARQIAVSIDGNLIFHPSGSIIQVLDMYTGEQVKLLRGHLDSINSCVFNAASQELYSGADDASIVVWSQDRLHEPSEGENAETVGDADCWSD